MNLLFVNLLVIHWGKIYFGEITHHHGGGFDMFFPESYDLHFGEKLDLN